MADINTSQGNKTAHHDHSPVYNSSRVPHTSHEDITHKYNILSLDGGGIRGLWSLLVIEKLLEYITSVEEDWAGEGGSNDHSFAPQAYPANVSQFERTFYEIEETGFIEGSSSTRGLDSSKRFLPCHYFDFICGSSTGALIAIMLGRLRMTVSDCINEYERLGDKIFGQPRFLATANFGFGRKEKYNADVLKDVFKDVARRRGEKGSIPTKFPVNAGVCKTFVTTVLTKKRGPGSLGATKTPHLLRNYKHDPEEDSEESHSARRARRTSTWQVRPRDAETVPGRPGRRKINYGPADDLKLWEVARAATAAPLFFKPFEKDDAIFEDGGFGRINNPTVEAYNEVCELNGGPNAIGTIVSIGTAKKDAPHARTLKARLFHIADVVTDTERLHEEMQTKQRLAHFNYHRLNDPGRLEIPFDEWKPRRKLLFTPKDPGSKTIGKIRSAFDSWAAREVNTRELAACARALVETRRSRAYPPSIGIPEERLYRQGQWERFATAARYDCKYPGCESETIYNKQDFRAHMKSHGVDDEKQLEERCFTAKKTWKYRSAQCQTGRA